VLDSYFYFLIPNAFILYRNEDTYVCGVGMQISRPPPAMQKSPEPFSNSPFIQEGQVSFIYLKSSIREEILHGKLKF
jgi:hypothetical protein